MERKYRVVSSGEWKTQEEADELVQKLTELGLTSQVRIVQEVSELLPLDEEQLAELGSVNFLEFRKLLNQIGAKPERAKRLWGDLMRWTTFVAESETPLYSVDASAILARASQKNRSSRLHFQAVVRSEERLAITLLDISSVAREIQTGEINERGLLGPVAVDELTMAINLRANQLSKTAQETSS